MEQGVGNKGVSCDWGGGFVGEDAVEGGAADAELAGGAEFVAAVEVEDVLDVVLDDGVEGEVFE